MKLLTRSQKESRTSHFLTSCTRLDWDCFYDNQDYSDLLNIFNNFLTKRWYKLIMHLMEKNGLHPNGLRILEIGCGIGLFSIFLSKIGHKVVGIDISMNGVQKAKHYAEMLNDDVGFLQSDAKNLPFEDDNFDVIICSETLEHIPNYEIVITEIKRLIKKGGFIIITVPNYLNPTQIGTGRPLEGLWYIGKKNSYHPKDINKFLLSSLIKTLEYYELKIIDSKGSGLIHFPSTKPIFKKIGEKLDGPFEYFKYISLNVGVIATK